jgi:hypothetical protein
MRTEYEIKKRIKLWKRFLEETKPYDDKSASEETVKLLGLESANLLSDYFYDEEAAEMIIKELEWVLGTKRRLIKGG